MKQFFVLKPIGGYFGTKWSFADKIDPVNLGSSDKCPVCGGAVSLKWWLPPYRVKLSSAKPEKWGDFLWVGGTSLAVSARLKELYEKEGLRGIDSFGGPIEVVRYGTRKSGDFPNPPPIYYVIHDPWGSANQDDIASEVSHLHPEKISCAFCREGVSGRKQGKVILDDATWNGDDIFRPRGAPVVHMVSQRFKEFCDKHQFENVWLIPGQKYGFDEHHPSLWYVNE